MKSHQKSWRIKDPIIKGMAIIRKPDQPENALANELLDEALRMRMHPASYSPRSRKTPGSLALDESGKWSTSIMRLKARKI